MSLIKFNFFLLTPHLHALFVLFESGIAFPRPDFPLLLAHDERDGADDGGHQDGEEDAHVNDTPICMKIVEHKL